MSEPSFSCTSDIIDLHSIGDLNRHKNTISDAQLDVFVRHADEDKAGAAPFRELTQQAGKALRNEPKRSTSNTELDFKDVSLRRSFAMEWVTRWHQISAASDLQLWSAWEFRKMELAGSSCSNNVYNSGKHLSPGPSCSTMSNSQCPPYLTYASLAHSDSDLIASAKSPADMRYLSDHQIKAYMATDQLDRMLSQARANEDLKTSIYGNFHGRIFSKADTEQSARLLKLQKQVEAEKAAKERTAAKGMIQEETTQTQPVLKKSLWDKVRQSRLTKDPETQPILKPGQQKTDA